MPNKAIIGKFFTFKGALYNGFNSGFLRRSCINERFTNIKVTKIPKSVTSATNFRLPRGMKSMEIIADNAMAVQGVPLPR